MVTKKTATKKTAKKTTPKKKPVKVIVENNETLNSVDIVFVLDATGSMQPYIDEAKRMITDITKRIVDGNKELSVRVALVAYRDHPPQEFTFVTQVHDFVSVDEFDRIIAGIWAGGGGDLPEAVWDGVDAAFGVSWREGADRSIYLIGDAPPHRQCLCGITPEALVEKLFEMKIEVNAHSIANMPATTEAFKLLVDATGGMLSVGNTPKHTSELYESSLLMKSAEISTARMVRSSLTSAGYTYNSAAVASMSADELHTVATSAGVTVDDVKSTAKYMNKRGL